MEKQKESEDIKPIDQIQENDIEDSPIHINNDREFHEVEGGLYNEHGFYVTPNGSFWDPDGIYFNKEGCDKHDGYYNEEYEYQPGRGWIPHMLCYEDEINNKHKEDDIDDDGLDYENLDDLHEELDYEKLTENKNKEECLIKKKVLTFTGENHPKNNKKKEEELPKEIQETVSTKIDVDKFFEGN